VYEIQPSRRSQPTATAAARPLVLAFQFGGRYSAEAFEALVGLAAATRQVRDGRTSRRCTSRSAVDVYDPDRPAPFVHEFSAAGCKLLGLPPQGGAATRADAAALATPMRGLALGSPSERATT